MDFVWFGGLFLKVYSGFEMELWNESYNLESGQKYGPAQLQKLGAIEAQLELSHHTQ